MTECVIAGFAPQSSVCEAPAGSKAPVISSRSQVSEVDRDDMRPDFAPHYVRVKP